MKYTSIILSLASIAFADYYVSDSRPFKPSKPHNRIQINVDSILAERPISTSVLSAMAPAATNGISGMNVIAGKGTNGYGDQCGCECLCGTGPNVTPSNAGLGAFGGLIGK